MALTSTGVQSTAPANAGVNLASEIEVLANFDLHQLRIRWRKLLRSAPPEHLSRSLLARILAYKIQARALGELDRETTRYLDRVANEQARRRRAGPGRGGRPKHRRPSRLSRSAAG